MTRFKTYLAIGCFWALILWPAALQFGCAGAGRTAYTTLASTELAVKSSYDGYLDSVLQGQTRTNEVPIISAGFDEFQSLMRVAIDRASGNTNALVTSDIAASSSALLQKIAKEKGVK